MAGKGLPLIWKFILIAFSLYLADYVGIFVHFFELDYTRYFELPIVNDKAIADNITIINKNNNYYEYKFLQKSINKCTTGVNAPHLTVLVKTALQNEQRRAIIRRTWGYEKRFSDVNYRCVFLLGASDDAQQMATIKDEAIKYGDIVQGDFIDAYFNNTIKTMLGIRWAKEYCIGSDYFMFVDDDYYVSIKNILKFIAYPELYPNAITGLWSQRQHLNKQKSAETGGEHLFAGYVMQRAPLRIKFSKWYVSLTEYPYDMWPPYVTAGAFVLSNDALNELYAVGKRMREFRFDDIFLSMLALSSKLTLTHCDMFYFERPKYNGAESYRYVLASHGFENSAELEKVWTECRSAGYA